MSGDINVSPMTPSAVAQQASAAAVTPASAKPVAQGSAVKPVDAGAQPQQTIDVVEQARASAEQLQDSIDQLNEFMKQGQRSLAFSVDDSADEVVVRVTDRETEELVRQIPTKEALQLREHLDSLLGLLFSSRV